MTGHPFIDIWAAVKPQAVGISAWPDVPYGEDWKTECALALAGQTLKKAGVVFIVPLTAFGILTQPLSVQLNG